MAIITSIGTANPSVKLTREIALNKIGEIFNIPGEQLEKLGRVYRSSLIETRYTVIEDFIKKDAEVFFKNGNFPGIADRMEIYKNEIPALAYKAIDNCLRKNGTDPQSITHVITCSSTGYYSPGLDIDIIANYNLAPGTGRTCLNNMGCCAAINGLKVAEAIADKDENSNVLLVCAELCTIHFRNKKSWKDLFVTSLFADGAAAVLISGKRQEKGIKINNFFTSIIPDKGKEVSWYIKDDGFEVNLSSYVPALVKDGIGLLLDSLFDKGNISKEEISLYALHPGGRKIIEVCEQALELEPKDAAYAYDVLRNYGNMSSPTILFVMEKIFDDPSKNPGDKILTLAFGPGLALESMLSEVV